jgi:predicted AlkP superfamily pyrophosphatase or phosphodiesterase
MNGHRGRANDIGTLYHRVMTLRALRRTLPILFAWSLLLFLIGCASRPAMEPAKARDPGHRPLVILVSIDGLPASFLSDGTLPTLDRLAAEGVRAEWMNPSYPTLTFPNHYTLVTGLRPDHHGMVHNNMLDASLGRFISKEDSADDGRWWAGEPIWATLQKQGGIAATMFWPGSRAEIAGERPRYSRAFDKTVPPAARVDQVLAWLDLPESRRPQLVTLYFDQYDVAAHIAGARSGLALASLREVDGALSQLLDGLSVRGLGNSAALIVVSDHGMADVLQTNSVLLDDMLDVGHYDIEWWGTFIGLRPHKDSIDVVERTFIGKHDHFTCWRKGDLPAAWRYGRHPRIPPIVCQVDVGWRVQGRQNPPQTQPVKGEHGFAPEDPTMRSVFVANGPEFRSGMVLPPFDNVDLYPLLAHLLGVKPAPNDGSLSSTAAALR